MTTSEGLSYRDKISTLSAVLDEVGSLTVLLIDLSDLIQVEQDYGSEAHQKVLDSAIALIAELKGLVIRKGEILGTSDERGDAVLIFPSQGRSGHPVPVAKLREMAARIEESTNRQLAQLASPFLRRRLSATVGYAAVVDNPLMRRERLLTRLIESAWESVNERQGRRRRRRLLDLQDLLIRGEMGTVHQPIARLSTREVVGYEALSRGPVDSPFTTPASLFGAAMECDLVYELDRLCRRAALRNSKGLPRSLKLFVNILPWAVYDSDFQGSNLIRMMEPLALTPEQIVLEVTEKYAIENYALFGEAVQSFTQMGFSIAVDDLGAGHSGLEKIAKLKPRYLKLDMTLIRSIDSSQVRREMVRALKAFADKINSRIIAEGIERKSELETILDLGIDLGQGFFLGRPEPLFAERIDHAKAKAG